MQLLEKSAMFRHFDSPTCRAQFPDCSGVLPAGSWSTCTTPDCARTRVLVDALWCIGTSDLVTVKDSRDGPPYDLRLDVWTDG